MDTWVFKSGGSISTYASLLVSSDGSSPPFSIIKRQLVSQSSTLCFNSSMLLAPLGLLTSGRSSLRMIDLSSLIGSAMRRHASRPLWRGTLRKTLACAAFSFSNGPRKPHSCRLISSMVAQSRSPAYVKATSLVMTSDWRSTQPITASISAVRPAK